ncbi:LysR family transcriptional regulator [Vibrio sp. E150_018]
MSIDTKWLEDFIVLSEMKNFSRAAEARFITQPAFGRHIKALEEAVGLQLIDRTTHPISLTPAGKQFRTTARNLVQQLEHGLTQLKGMEQQLFTPLKVATPHSLASPSLMNLVEQVHVGYELPYSVDVLRVDQASQSLIDGQSDILFAFDVMELLQPPFQNIPVGKGHFLLVSAVDKAGHPIFNPFLESTLPLLRYSSESYSARLIESHVGIDFGFSFKTCFESSMCQLHKDMAMRGKGLAWLPSNLIIDELKNGQLFSFNTEKWCVPYQMRVYRNQSRLSDQGETFWKQLTKQVQEGWSLS